MKAFLDQSVWRIARGTMFALAIGAGLFASAAAQAQYHHGHGGWGYGPRVGIYFGPGFYYPPVAPYYYPPPVVVPAQPQVYIERPSEGVMPAPQAQPQPQGNAYYFCAESNAYYPYVRECPGGWRQVAPQPAR